MRNCNKGRVKILSDYTYKKLNIKVDELSTGSHKQICVQCERCNEIFLRERRKLYQLHSCPTHVIRDDGIKLKWCSKCQSWLTYIKFSSNKARTDNLNSICKDCGKTTPTYKRSNQSKIAKRQSLLGWMTNFLATKKNTCKKRGVDCSITVGDLMNLWQNQDGHCYYSDIELTYGQKKIHSANLDRLDSSKGYILNNIVWASQGMNNLKNCHSTDEVYSFLLNAKFFRARLEYKLEHPDAKLPERKRTTDVGWDLHAVEDYLLNTNILTSINTGICISCPEDFYLTIEGRSGLYAKGIYPARGIIDAGFTDTLKVMLINMSKPYQIQKGDRIGQLILHRAWTPDFTEVKEFTPNYNMRGKSGFGSSGR